MTVRLALERKVAIDAVTRASRVCQTVFKTLVSSETLTKKDNSPVTVADYSAQAVVNAVLKESFLDDPVVGEEDAADLRAETVEKKKLKERVVELANTGLDVKLSEEKILEAIDRGTYAGGPKGRHWTLDPIDGTKGFLRGEQYAICLALIVDGQVELGVIGCPNLPTDSTKPDGDLGCIFVAVRGQGAFQRSMISPKEQPISMSDISSTVDATFCESVEAAHSSHDDAARIAAQLGIRKPSVRMDSQCKYCAISRGSANIYLRLPTRKDYEEKIWDHAAGALLVHEAGGIVTDVTGKPLDFSIGRTLKANSGVVASCKRIHTQVLDAVKSVLQIQ